MKIIPNFHFDELVWKQPDGRLIDQAITELASMPNDAEFEKLVWMIRISRALSGLSKYRDSGIMRDRINKGAVRTCGHLICLLDRLLRLKE